MSIIATQNQDLIENICYLRMAMYSILMSYATSEEKKCEYQRKFNHYKFYDI